MSHACPPRECYAAIVHPDPSKRQRLPRVPTIHVARTLMDDSDAAYLAGNRRLAKQLTTLAGNVLDWLDGAAGCPSCRCTCDNCAGAAA